jgi:pyrimidine 5'-nucleotidase
MQLRSLRDLKADLWVFDCDGVIYDNTKEAEREIVKMMTQFISSRYKCNNEEAINIRRGLLKKHQVPHSIMALVREGFDEQEILDETYFAIDLQNLGIVPSPTLQRLLFSLSGEKVLLTNNHGGYARKILCQKGISKHFSKVYGIKELGLIQKPDLLAFQFVQDATGIKENIIFIDDKINNVIAAERFGWMTVWKGHGNGFDGLCIRELE